MQFVYIFVKKWTVAVNFTQLTYGNKIGNMSRKVDACKEQFKREGIGFLYQGPCQCRELRLSE